MSLQDHPGFTDQVMLLLHSTSLRSLFVVNALYILNHLSFHLWFVIERSLNRSETLFRLYCLSLYWTVWCCYTQSVHKVTRTLSTSNSGFHTQAIFDHRHRSLRSLLSPWLSLYTCLKSCCTAYKPLLHHFLFRWEVRATPVVFPSLALNDASQVVKYLAVQVTGYSHTVWWRVGTAALSLDSLVSSSRVQQSSARVIWSVVAIMLECDSIGSFITPVASCSNLGYLFLVPRYTL